MSTLRKCVAGPRGPRYVEMTPDEMDRFEADRAHRKERPRRRNWQEEIDALEKRVASLETKVAYHDDAAGIVYVSRATQEPAPIISGSSLVRAEIIEPPPPETWPDGPDGPDEPEGVEADFNPDLTDAVQEAIDAQLSEPAPPPTPELNSVPEPTLPQDRPLPPVGLGPPPLPQRALSTIERSGMSMRELLDRAGPGLMPEGDETEQQTETERQHHDPGTPVAGDPAQETSYLPPQPADVTVPPERVPGGGGAEPAEETAGAPEPDLAPVREQARHWLKTALELITAIATSDQVSYELALQAKNGAFHAMQKLEPEAVIRSLTVRQLADTIIDERKRKEQRVSDARTIVARAEMAIRAAPAGAIEGIAQAALDDIRMLGE